MNETHPPHVCWCHLMRIEVGAVVCVSMLIGLHDRMIVLGYCEWHWLQFCCMVPTILLLLHLLSQVYEGLPKISENLLVIIWILTLSPNFHCHLWSSHLGLVYNDPSHFAVFGSTHWSLPALAYLVPVVILLGSLQWIQSAALSSRVSF